MINPEDYFTSEELEQQETEGYAFFDCEDGFSFQRNDEMMLFKDDFEAWRFVLLKSINSQFHEKIVNYVKQHIPNEYKELTTKKIQKEYFLAQNVNYF